MSWVNRFANLFRREELYRELDEELASHMEEAVERGRSAAEAQRALGNALLRSGAQPGSEAAAVAGSCSVRIWSSAGGSSISTVPRAPRRSSRWPWRSAPRRLPFGWWMPFCCASCRSPSPTASFFSRPASSIARATRTINPNSTTRPSGKYRDLVADRADLLLAGMAARQDAQFGSGGEPEKVYRQYVSGNLFGVFGLQPAFGRLLHSE